MRELWAKRIAIFTGLLVLALALAFARHQNPPSRAIAHAPAPQIHEGQSALIETGRKVYAESGCARCHAIAGQGNPRYPLDGIGAQLSQEEMLFWITAPDEMADMLPERAFRAKQSYRDLPRSQLDALIAYLMSLQDTPPAAGD